jgi:Ca2+-binding EF-hand superfamily protein
MGGARPQSAPAVGRDRDFAAIAEGMLSDARQELKSMGVLKSLKPVEQQRLRQVFKAIDLNGDGRITAAEMRSAMRRDGILASLKAVEDMLWEICEDRVDRGATFREIALCYVRAKKGAQEPHRLYTYLFYKMMDEENAGDDPDDLFKESGLRKDEVVKYLAPQVGEEQINGYVNALFGSALGEEEAAVERRRTFYSADLTSPTNAGKALAAAGKRGAMLRSATEERPAKGGPDRHHQRHGAVTTDTIAAQTFCRVAQSCLWKTVPEGQCKLVPFAPLELRRPITVRMQEQTALIREQFKILEAEERLQKHLKKKRFTRMTTTERRHQNAVEMKEKAARMKEEFGDQLKFRMRVATQDLYDEEGFAAPQERHDKGDVEFAHALGVGMPELKRVKDVFVDLDKDGNGRIDFEEFHVAIEKLLAPDHLETTHVKRIWEQLCIPPKKEVPFMDFAKWYVEHFVRHNGRPDIQGLLGQTRKSILTPEEVASWHPKRNA